MIGDSLLHSTLPYDYRDSPGEFRMTVTAYVTDINKKNAGYIYDQSYRQVWPPHDPEYILNQRGRHWSRD